jgi:hypothetical protein
MLVSDLREAPLDKMFKVWDSPIWFIVMVESFYAHDLRLGGHEGIDPFRRIRS